MQPEPKPEISAQTFLFVMGVALVLLTGAICAFVRWGDTLALVATFTLLLAMTGGVIAFASRFIGDGD